MNSKTIVNNLVLSFMIVTICFIRDTIGCWGVQKPYVNGSDTDVKVINTLRKYYLEPPPMKRYAISHPTNYDPSQGQTKAIRKIFKDMKGGVFVECGSTDGIFLSNTIYFERELNWRGLLIEADKKSYAKLKETNRNAYTSNACLSVTKIASVKIFKQVIQKSNQEWWFKGVGKLEGIGSDAHLNDEKRFDRVKVQCFPFYTYMLALNVTTIDYLSLDVEGAELDILQTIPFDKIDIKVLTVEWKHYTQTENALTNFFKSKNYLEFKQTNDLTWNQDDKIFIKKGFSI